MKRFSIHIYVSEGCLHYSFVVGFQTLDLTILSPNLDIPDAD